MSQNSESKPNKKLFCSRCEKDAIELFECQRCTENVCDKCLAEYNQFTQIDYDCCKSCAKGKYDIDGFDEQGQDDF